MSRSGVQIPLHPLYNKEKEGKKINRNGVWGSPQKGWNLNGSAACKILDSILCQVISGDPLSSVKQRFP